MVREAQEMLDRSTVTGFCLKTAYFENRWEDKLRKNMIVVFVREANRRIAGKLHPRP